MEVGKVFMFRNVTNILSQFYASCILSGVSQISEVDSFFLSHLFFYLQKNYAIEGRTHKNTGLNKAV